MQQLHLVGFTTDRKRLILSARRGTKSGGYTIALDEHLVGVIDDALRREEGEDGDRLEHHRRFARQESQLSPREIQSRLRSGSTLTEVARAAGVDEDWVARFAAPILAEQAQVIDRARELRYSTPRKGLSAQPLGVAVRWNVADRGVRLGDGEFEAAWGAFQLRDGAWVVRFSFVSRQRPQDAEWEIDFDEGTVTARNRLAANIGYIAPRTRPPAAELLVSTAPVAAPPPDDEQPAEPPTGAKKRGARKKASRKKAARKKKAAPRKRAAAKKKAAVKKRAAPKKKKAAVKKRAAPKKKKAAAKKRGVSRAAAKKATKAPAPRVVTRASPAVKRAVPPPRATSPVAASFSSATPQPPPPRPAAPAERVEPRRVVTIRADRATPPTQSQLGSSARRRRRAAARG